jgi:hypothetical protein
MKSLRDHQVEIQNHSLRAQRIAKRAGRPDRNRILEHQEAVDSADRAAEQCERALADLQALDIYCLDPIHGLALIPFVHRSELAWFVFDLFDSDPLRHWRYHHDPLEMRRPIAEAIDTSGSNYVV